MRLSERKSEEYYIRRIKNANRSNKKDAFGIHELDILLTCVTIQVEGMKILVVFIPIWNIIYNSIKSYEKAIPIAVEIAFYFVKTMLPSYLRL